MWFKKKITKPQYCCHCKHFIPREGKHITEISRLQYSKCKVYPEEPILARICDELPMDDRAFQYCTLVREWNEKGKRCSRYQEDE